MKIWQAIKETVNDLTIYTSQSQEDSEIEVKEIFTHVLNISKPSLYKKYDYCISKYDLAKINHILSLRKNDIPLSYILNSHTFYKNELHIDENVLIPRSETESIVDKIIEIGDSIFQRENRCVFLDAGTGSGCVGISIANERPKWNIILSDLYVGALNVAKTNSKLCKYQNISLVCADWLSPFSNNSIDLIFSNPPYIPLNDMNVDNSVLDNEPLSALFSGEDGLKDMKKIIQSSRNILTLSGVLFLENGINQSKDVSCLLELNDFTDITVHLDYNMKKRFTSSKRYYG